MSKFFYQPIRPFVLHQKFGENKACVNDSLNVITCDGNNPPPGYRSLYGPGGHKGLDLAAYHGQEIYCSQGGVVDDIDTNPKSGLDIRIRTKVGGREFIHVYEHLLGYQKKIGDIVETGELIGWADNTGYSSGDHLHFELKEIIDGRAVPIDPLPLMEPIFARDILNIVQKIKELTALIMDRLAAKLRG